MASRKKKTAATLEDAPTNDGQRTYEEVAQRVLAAVEEFNAAFQEAHEHPQVRVEGAWTPPEKVPPLQFSCKIFRLTHTSPVLLRWRLRALIDEDGEQNAWVAKLDDAAVKAT